MKKILVTGHTGYIGALLVPLLLNEGYDAEVLLSWGDPIHAGMDGFVAADLTAEEQKKQFGYNRTISPTSRSMGVASTGFFASITSSPTKS